MAGALFITAVKRNTMKPVASHFESSVDMAAIFLHIIANGHLTITFQY